MPLYFVRHGESLANEQNYFTGSQNSPLTRLGRRQAQQAARYVQQRALHFDQVHVSTLERAQATAAIILHDVAPMPEVVSSAALVERNFGIFAGKNKTLIKKSVGHAVLNATSMMPMACHRTANTGWICTPAARPTTRPCWRRWISKPSTCWSSRINTSWKSLH
ncbi:phosphoglycerate mutase family protein [Xanthomonas campestris pv. raphani]|nr:phosphoglycerate mutase family protein [Xanthomonas campestris]MEA9652110.1 phosphoglycerate mutase family protein [Xanthomonas campestris pv. raphani]MEA9736215.1 phosphoglycerate mutase family protein [Xanthomonas campestris pv. raphani]MEA9742002.1 phosphoglycerate mutase family protein [Xanthomonas campestris pv. raphani]MEA9869734.1 phosphoglycerate mutase family protein [Xanthomonas campestris pv. raphani]